MPSFVPWSHQQDDHAAVASSMTRRENSSGGHENSDDETEESRHTWINSKNKEEYVHLALVCGWHFALEVAKEDGFDLLGVDQDLVLEALTDDGMNLEYAPAGLQNNRGIVNEAVQNNGAALQFASVNLRKDRDIVMTAVKNQQPCLLCGREEGNNNNVALAFASEELRDDEMVVTEAVQTFGWALEFASPRLRDKEAVVFTNLVTDFDKGKDYGSCFQFASDRLRRDKDVIWRAVQISCHCFFYAITDELLQDKNLPLLAKILCHMYMQGGRKGELLRSEFASRNGAMHRLLLTMHENDLCDDDFLRPFAIQIVRNHSDDDIISHLPSKFWADREVVFAAVQRHASNADVILSVASIKLRSDRDFVLQCVKCAPQSFYEICDELKQDREIVLEAVKGNWTLLAEAPQHLRSDRDFGLKCVKCSPQSFYLLCNELKNDPELQHVFAVSSQNDI